MSESAPLLEVRGITKQYPGVLALKGVDFDVRAGEVHCLLGPNGAGKSTLIKCVSGVVAPTEGEIRVNGELLPVGEPSESMAFGVGTIYQELDLVEDLRCGREHLPRPRAAPARPARPRADAFRDHGAARAPRSRRHQARHVRPHAAPRRAAGGLDRPRALAQREAADHGRAVLDPRRRRGRDPVRRRPPAGRRRRGRHLHLAPPRRDPAHRRSRDGALRRRARWRPACRPTRRAASWWRRWSAARSISSIPTRAKAHVGRGRARRPRRLGLAAREASAASRSARARSSGSAGSSAPAAPSCCG